MSSSRLTATVPAANIATANTSAITVSNPTPGGGTSNVAYFAITSPAPVLTFTTINPNTAPVERPKHVLAFGTNPLRFGGPVFAVGDFNGDGKLDIAIPQNTGNSVSVQLGDGDGSFAPAVDYTVGASPNFVLAANFNGDGNLDLAVASGMDESISILLGNGNGTFQSALIVSPVPAAPAAQLPSILPRGISMVTASRTLSLRRGKLWKFSWATETARFRHLPCSVRRSSVQYWILGTA